MWTVEVYSTHSEPQHYVEVSGQIHTLISNVHQKKTAEAPDILENRKITVIMVLGNILFQFSGYGHHGTESV